MTPITDPGQSRTRFITHQGEQILLLDYSDVSDENVAIEEIEKTKAIIAREPENSLRTLTYVAGSRYNPRIVEAMKDLVVHNKPYVRAAAVVGLHTLHRIIYRAVVTVSRRNLKVFEDLEEAKDWLVTQ